MTFGNATNWTDAELARLHAAAPDLLAACERAVAWLRRIEVEYPGSVNQDAIDKHIVPAIAKAKGGAA